MAFRATRLWRHFLPEGERERELLLALLLYLGYFFCIARCYCCSLFCLWVRHASETSEGRNKGKVCPLVYLLPLSLTHTRPHIKKRPPKNARGPCCYTRARCLLQSPRPHRSIIFLFAAYLVNPNKAPPEKKAALLSSCVCRYIGKERGYMFVCLHCTGLMDCTLLEENPIDLHGKRLSLEMPTSTNGRGCQSGVMINFKDQRIL